MFKQHLGLVISLTILLAGLATGVVLVRQQQIIQKQAGVTCPAGQNAYCDWNEVVNVNTYHVCITEDSGSPQCSDVSQNYLCFTAQTGKQYTCEVYPNANTTCPDYGQGMKGSTSSFCEVLPTPQPGDITGQVEIRGAFPSGYSFYRKKVMLFKSMTADPQAEYIIALTTPPGSEQYRFTNIPGGDYSLAAGISIQKPDGGYFNLPNENVSFEPPCTGGTPNRCPIRVDGNLAGPKIIIQLPPMATLTPTPEVCPYRTRLSIFDVTTGTGDLITESGFSYSWELRNPNNEVTSSGTRDLTGGTTDYGSTDNLDPRFRNNTATVTLHYPQDRWEIVHRTCVPSPGSSANCPNVSGTSPTISGFNVVCGANYDYGWKLQRLSPPTTGTISGTVRAINPDGHKLYSLGICGEDSANNRYTDGCDAWFYQDLGDSTSQDFSISYMLDSWRPEAGGENLINGQKLKVAAFLALRQTGPLYSDPESPPGGFTSGWVRANGYEITVPAIQDFTITIPAPVCSSITYTLNPSLPPPDTQVIVDISRSGASSCSGNWDNVGLLLDDVEQGIALCDHNGNNCGNMYHSTVNSGSAGEHTLQFTVNQGSCSCNEMEFTTKALITTLRVIEAGAPSADLDGSGSVDAGDASVMFSAWGSASGDSNFNSAADLDGDGAITALDVSILMSQFGQGTATTSETSTTTLTEELTAPTVQIAPTSTPVPTAPTAGKSLIQTLIDFVLNLFNR